MPVKLGEPVNYQSSCFARGISVNLPLVLVQCWHVSWKHTFSELFVVPGLLETEFAPRLWQESFSFPCTTLQKQGAQQPEGADCTLEPQTRAHTLPIQTERRVAGQSDPGVTVHTDNLANHPR